MHLAGHRLRGHNVGPGPDVPDGTPPVPLAPFPWSNVKGIARKGHASEIATKNGKPPRMPKSNKTDGQKKNLKTMTCPLKSETVNAAPLRASHLGSAGPLWHEAGAVHLPLAGRAVRGGGVGWPTAPANIISYAKEVLRCCLARYVLLARTSALRKTGNGGSRLSPPTTPQRGAGIQASPACAAGAAAPPPGGRPR